MFLGDVSDVLGRLGLKPAESEVYLTCLHAKDGLRVQQLAERTSIKRSTINLILERLLDKSFLTYHLEGSRKVFTAQPPEHLLYEAESTVQDLRSIIPLLLANTKSSGGSRVRFFEGKDDVTKIYNDHLLTQIMNNDPRKEILSITSGQDVFKVMPDHQRQFINRRIKEQIPIRWIAPDNELARSFLPGSRQAFRQMRFFDPNTYHFDIEFDVYADKVSMSDLKDNKPSGFIIENAGIARSMRSLFNLLWNSLPEVDKPEK